MVRIDGHNLILLLRALEGTHVRSRREQAFYRLSGSLLLLSGFLLALSCWLFPQTQSRLIDISVGVCLLGGAIVGSIYFYAASYLTYRVDGQQIQSTAPFGLLTWSLERSSIRAVSYIPYSARTLTLFTSHEKRTLVLIDSMYEALYTFDAPEDGG